MTTAPTEVGAAGRIEQVGETVSMVTRSTDPQQATRRLRLHHVLVRRPRWSKEFDCIVERLYGPKVTEPSPWDDPAFVAFHEEISGRRVTR